MAVTDDLNAAIAQLTFNASNNAPIATVVIKQLQAVGAEMSPGAPLNELNDAINQLAFAAPNNAPVSQAVINELNDVLSQLLYGTETTSQPDLAAISGISNEILKQEPDWGNLLWMNWDGSTNLTVQVINFYTLVLPISASPWWTNWDTFQDAASELISMIYLQTVMNGATVFYSGDLASSSG